MKMILAALALLVASQSAQSQALNIYDDAATGAIIAAVKADMPPDERKLFEKATVHLFIRLHPQTAGMNMMEGLKKLGTLQGSFAETSEGAFDNLTVQMILDEMESIR